MNDSKLIDSGKFSNDFLSSEHMTEGEERLGDDQSERVEMIE